MQGKKQAAALLAAVVVLFAGGAQSATAAELSAPAAASWNSTRFDLIARGADGLIYQKYYDESMGIPGGWSGWGSIGAPPVGAASSPTVTSPGPNVLQVFVRGGDNQIWNNHWTNGQGSAPGGWSGWGAVPNTGNATWAPAATNGGDNTPDVFYTGTDGAVWYTRYDNTLGWVPPVSLGGQALASPAATTTVGGRMQVAVRGTDSRIYLRFADSPSGWTAWGVIPGASTSMVPGVSSGEDGQFNMFFRGYSDANMYHEYYNPSAGWVGPGGIPGTTLVSSPAAARLHVYARDSQGDIQQRYYNAVDGWRGPRSIGQPSSDGKLFREQNSPAVYYLLSGVRYWVSSPEAAQAFGLDLGSTTIVPDGSLNSVPRGGDLTEDGGPGGEETGLVPVAGANYSTASNDAETRGSVLDLWNGTNDGAGDGLTSASALLEQSQGRVTQNRLGAGCVTNAWARRTKRSLLGGVMYRFRLNINFCFSGTSVTSTNVWVRWEDEASTANVIGVVASQTRWFTALGSSHGGRRFYRKGRVDNCILKYGCIATSYPWIEARLLGDGHWTWQGGS